MPVLVKQRCKEQSRAKFYINSFFFKHAFMELHNESNPKRGADGMHNGRCLQQAVHSVLFAAAEGSAVFLLLYYRIESAVMSVKKDQGGFQDWVMWSPLPPLPACMQINRKLFMGYPWQNLEKKDKSKQEDGDVKMNGRPKAKHTTFT